MSRARARPRCPDDDPAAARTVRPVRRLVRGGGAAGLPGHSFPGPRRPSSLVGRRLDADRRSRVRRRGPAGRRGSTAGLRIVEV